MTILRRLAFIAATMSLAGCVAVRPSLSFPASSTAVPSPTLSGTTIPNPTTPIVEPTPEPTEPPLALAASVAFWTPLHGIVVGNGLDGQGEVWTTSDGGHSWTATQPGIPPLFWVTTAGTWDAWAVTTCEHPGLPMGCTVWSSHDGGLSWHQVAPRQVSGISFVDASHGWGVLDNEPTPGGAASSGVFRTADGGRTWTEISARPCEGYFGPVAVSFVSSRHGWIGCMGVAGAGQAEKSVVETVDGGATWSVRASVSFFGGPNVGTISSSDYLGGLSMRPSGSGIIWEGRGGTLRTRDGGRTWTEIPPGGTDAGPIPAGAWAASDSDWYVVMWNGDLQATALWASHDGGSTWKPVSRVPPLGSVTASSPYP